jgi:hypothetical protein
MAIDAEYTITKPIASISTTHHNKVMSIAERGRLLSVAANSREPVRESAWLSMTTTDDFAALL